MRKKEAEEEELRKRQAEEEEKQRLEQEKVELRQLRVKYPRDSFFSKSWRQAIIQPGGLEQTSAADDLYPGKQKLQLCFELPRGSYATILVKRLS